MVQKDLTPLHHRIPLGLPLTPESRWRHTKVKTIGYRQIGILVCRDSDKRTDILLSLWPGFHIETTTLLYYHVTDRESLTN